MAKLGQACYCDGCGVEIVNGDNCVSCDPEQGSEEVSFLFVGNYIGDDTQLTSQQPTPEWWQFWKR